MALTPIIIAIVKTAVLIGGIMTAAAYFVLLERWIAAWVQDRRGPNRVGLAAERPESSLEGPPSLRAGTACRGRSEDDSQGRVHTCARGSTSVYSGARS